VPDVLVVPDASALAVEVAARVLPTLAAAQGSTGRAALALTAGSIMEQVWAALPAAPDVRSVDWGRVDVYWGDERFVPHDSPERNDVPAEQGLFATAPFSDSHRFSMPASDGAEDLDAAAASYAEVVNGRHVDLVLLGVGPDGHCCSLFPGHPGLEATDPIIPVRNSPKPPPERLSFSFDTLNGADEIWVVGSGDGKAEALARAFTDADPVQTPVAGAHGRRRTLWLLDQDAASQLPEIP
jgi:6-phosphogluconolactonase